MPERYRLQNMHCQSACGSIAGAMSLKCRSALCNCWSAVTPKHVLPDLRLSERIVSKTCTAGAPSALLERCVFSAEAPYPTVGALWL
ncbi:hypothetical protein AMTR_s00009p00241330 [Amborella trichopoda]|uniref:Uncharacterized protein n=1 Tax=Amborella trichopoda TaxID=13333 RepID=W1NHQ2_AMBTC|nr:hypothetical protein AMTR_s00009p00241330 [Amborella trichopoda]